jgi:glycosyltransferase involved in cell wall biosynthesis
MAWCTILTPLFNGIEYFKECYDSVVTQTDKGWIWIIGINGHGPTNPIYDQLLQLANERIIVKNYSTVGKVETLNAMISEVSSIYVAILDCDDIWIPQKLEFQKNILLSNPKIDVLGTGCKYIGNLDHSPTLPVGHITLETLLHGTNPIINSSVVCRKKGIVWDSKFYGLDDYDLWLRIRKMNKKIYNCPEILVLHRIHNNSFYNSKGNHKLVSKLLKKYKEYK